MATSLHPSLMTGKRVKDPLPLRPLSSVALLVTYLFMAEVLSRVFSQEITLQGNGGTLTLHRVGTDAPRRSLLIAGRWRTWKEESSSLRVCDEIPIQQLLENRP